MSQLYPPENGPRLLREQWFVDDISGMLIPASRTVRDYYHRLVDRDTLDELGRDELNVGFTPRPEASPDNP
jgi:hypothetical protein